MAIIRYSAILLVLAAILAAGGYGASQYLGTDDTKTEKHLTHTVGKEDLLVTVKEDGNVESAENTDIKCQVAGGSSILWIVQDGKVVKKDEKLVEMDKAQLEEQINQQRITLEKARSAVTQAEKDFSVATISVQEYMEVYKRDIQDSEALIKIAEENLRSSQNSLDYTRRMFRKGYVSTLDLEGAQFSVQRAQLELDSARTSKEVLEKFTKAKTLEDLQSKVETARAKMESERAAFELEQGRLTRLESQIANCLILAPQDGMVVYANDASRSRFGGSQGPMIEEGAQVRERQTILRLPDLAKMQVKVNVHETKVESLRIGMPASIRIQGREWKGQVKSIANQPEPSSWFSATVKEYGTIVQIDGDVSGLRPGMTAEVEILIEHRPDVLTVPVAAIVENNGSFSCWVKVNGKLEKRPLLLGQTNDRFVEIKDGVAEGDEVIMNPRAVVPEARTPQDVELPKVDVQDKFGEGGPAGPPGGPATGGPGAGGPGAGPGAGGPGAGAPGGGAPGGGPPGAGGSGRPRVDWSQLDADKDGKISKDEAPEQMQRFFDRIDANGDGFLDEAERAAMRSGAGGGRVGAPGEGPGGGAGGGGPPGGSPQP
jgi:HlyD family secretion protein